MKQLVQNMIKKYPVSKHGTHIAILEYSTGVSVHVPLDFSFEQSEQLDALQNLRPSRGSEANVEKLLKVVSTVFSFKNGGRPSALKMLLLLTDEKPNKELTEVAKPLKQSGVRVYVVTVGDNVSPDDYVDVIPGKSTTYPANSTDEIPSLSEQIETDIIKVAKRGKLKIKKSFSVWATDKHLHN